MQEQRIALEQIHMQFQAVVTCVPLGTKPHYLLYLALDLQHAPIDAGITSWILGNNTCKGKTEISICHNIDALHTSHLGNRVHKHPPFYAYPKIMVSNTFHCFSISELQILKAAARMSVFNIDVFSLLKAKCFVKSHCSVTGTRIC